MLRCLGVGALCAGLIGCSVDPDRPLIEAVELEPSSLTLNVGASARVKAFALDSFGRRTDVSEQLASNNDSIVRLVAGDIDDDGALLRAVGGGKGAVVVNVGGVAGEAQVDVACPDASELKGPTNHSGTISASERWSAIDSPHRITGDLTISGTDSCVEGDPGCVCDAGTCTGPAVVSIQSCAEVIVAANARVLVGNGGAGSLRVEGAFPTDHKVAETTPGLVTFRPESGAWGGFVLDNRAPIPEGQVETQVDEPTLIQGALIRDAGGGGDPNSGAIVVVGAEGSRTAPTLRGVLIVNSASNGVVLNEFSGLSVASDEVVVRGAGGAPWRVHANQAGAVTSGASTDNKVDAVVVTGGVVSATANWSRIDIPYQVETSVVVSGDAVFSPNLFIGAGTEVRFQKGAGLFVGTVPGASGGVFIGPVTAGTISGNPPLLTSAQPEASRAPGDWIGLVMGAYAIASSSLRRGLIEFAGGPSALAGGDGDYEHGDDGGLILQTKRVTIIEQMEVRDSAGYGVVHAYQSKTAASIVAKNPKIVVNEKTFALGAESRSNPLKLESEVIKTTEPIGAEYYCSAAAKSPPIKWSYDGDDPTGVAMVKSFAVLITRDDPSDAQATNKTLWLAHDLPPTPAELKADASEADLGGKIAVPFDTSTCPAQSEKCAEMEKTCDQTQGKAKTVACAEYAAAGCLVNYTVTVFALGAATLDLQGKDPQLRSDAEAALRAAGILGTAQLATQYEKQ